MTNVVHLRLPRRQTLADRLTGLTTAFAHNRRRAADVYWLKENAELLNILETTRPTATPALLEPYAESYAQMADRLSFFPQYYRFFLGICLDLEDLGWPGELGEALCARVKVAGLAEAELSDLQRAEARRLLSRRITMHSDAALKDRLRTFANRSETFAIPNKKAAYELTHIVFYLSEYGRVDPQVDADTIVSLEYAGLLAYLDQNVDLLAEICVALRYANQTPSPIWEAFLTNESRQFVMSDDPTAPLSDAYHEYLVTNWWAGVSGADAFAGPVPEGGITFHHLAQNAGPLRHMSQALFELGDQRRADWDKMRDTVADSVSADQYDVLVSAERSSQHFGAFFERFARARA